MLKSKGLECLICDFCEVAQPICDHCEAAKYKIAYGIAWIVFLKVCLCIFNMCAHIVWVVKKYIAESDLMRLHDIFYSNGFVDKIFVLFYTCE